MDAVFLFLGLVVLITLVGMLFILIHPPRGQNPPGKKIEGTNFIPSQMIMGSDGLGGLAVNERTHQMCLFKSPDSPPRLLPITDLIGSYMIKNGEMMGEGKRGYPKEIVAFLDDLHHTKESLIKSLHFASSPGGNQRIDLLVVVHDPEDPILVLNFLDMETKEGGILFEKAMSTTTHWHYVLDGLILQADQLAQVQSETIQENEMAEATP